jgi:hypothetical protein
MIKKQTKEKWEKEWIDFQFSNPIIRCRYCDFDEDKQKPKVCRFHKKLFRSLLAKQQHNHEILVNTILDTKESEMKELIKEVEKMNKEPQIFSLHKQEYEARGYNTALTDVINLLKSKI